MPFIKAPAAGQVGGLYQAGGRRTRWSTRPIHRAGPRVPPHVPRPGCLAALEPRSGWGTGPPVGDGPNGRGLPCWAAGVVPHPLPPSAVWCPHPVRPGAERGKGRGCYEVTSSFADTRRWRPTSRKNAGTMGRPMAALRLGSGFAALGPRSAQWPMAALRLCSGFAALGPRSAQGLMADGSRKNAGTMGRLMAALRLRSGFAALGPRFAQGPMADG